MPKIKIDGHEIEVAQGTKVIEAAERLGIIIPRFCYHPALGAVGACRVCAVKCEGPVKGIQMSCMTEARDGLVVSTTDEEAVDFRRQVIEWLMMNHPHDCPVCDEGGHCLLQTLTIAGGHGIRRYPGNKRTYRDQYLGVFVQHEMNRCIHCYRCWRFYQGFAGYRDLGCLQIAHHTYFGRFSDGPLESPFAGNLVDICPTGVYTDKPSRFTGRRWDFERSPSLCIHCSLGCNTVNSTRYREMVRQESRFHKSVNGFFICDRGRYGFSYESLPERPRRASIGREQASWGEALKKAGDTLARMDPASVACLGSTRSSLENQGMLKRFCQLLEWEEPRYFETRPMARKIQRALSRLDKQVAVSLREIESADFILAVGADPINEAPMLALAMRQAFRAGAEVAPMFPLPMRPFTLGATVAVMDPRPVSLPLEFDHFPMIPGEIEPVMNRLVKSCVSREIAAQLGPEALKFYDAVPQDYPPGPFTDRWAGLQQKLLQSKKPVIICGTDIVRESTILSAADDALLLKAAKGWAGLFYVMPSANSFGAALLSPSGDSLEEIVEGIENGTVRALVVVENDPFWLYPDGERLKQALGKLDLLLVLDYLPSRIAEQAHIFFPSTPLFETETRFVNQEGRVQWAKPVHAGGRPIAQVGGGSHPPRVYGGALPGGEPKPAWRILAELAEAISAQRKRVSLPASIEDLWRWMVQEQPAFAGLQGLDVPPEGFLILPDHSKEQAFSSSSRTYPLTPPSPAKTPSPLRGEGEGGGDLGDYFTASEGGERVNSDFLEVLTVDWTFGTEELSSYSRFIRQVENPPSLTMHSRDAATLGFKDQDRVVLNLDRGPLEVGVRTMDNMASGVMVLPRHRQLAWQKMKEIPARIPVERIRKV